MVDATVLLPWSLRQTTQVAENVTPQVDGAAEFHLTQIFLNTF
jgi:hypothetical protein